MNPKLVELEIKMSISEYITKKDLVEELRLLADSMSNHAALAEKIKISPQYLSDILAGRRDPGAAVLQFLKVEKVVVYRDIKNDPHQK